MKVTAGQVQNIVFTGIVACVAVGLYLLSGKLAPPPETPASSPTPAVVTSVSDEEEARFASVPESVYLEQIKSNPDFRKKKNKQEDRAYTLVHGDGASGSAVLSYTVRDGDIESVTFTFVCRDKPPAKPKTEIEQRLAADYPAFLAAQNEAVRSMLPAVLSACDLDGVLIEPVLLRWYAGALAARDDGKYYTDKFAGCAFLAYPSKLADENVVICSLLLP